MSVAETSFLVLDIWLPQIRYGQRAITAGTSFLLQLATLFSVSRHVLIDAELKTVTISSRTFWFAFTTETIPFSKIRYIDISELTVGESPGLTRDGIGWRDQQENFIPYLMTTEGKKIELISFYGAGAVQTGWSGVLLGDQMVDFKGRQEIRAREFIAKVAAMIDVPCGVDSTELAKARSTTDKIKCETCGHFNADCYTKCLYCGAPLNKSNAAGR